MTEQDTTRPLVIQESAEMYLETILILQNEGHQVRSIDIARKMGHSRATVSEWMKKLVANGYLLVDADGIVTFTDKGQSLAKKVYERHVLLTDLFTSIGVSPDIAMEDACRVEHYISDETFSCMKRHFGEHRS